MRILIATDACAPQVNGVVHTLDATAACLRRLGHEVLLQGSAGLPTFAVPACPDIRLACRPYARVAQAIETFAPDALHIATEGPLGLAARKYCLAHGLSFTTSYHTRFPEYLKARFGVPPALAYRWLRWFHAPATAVMVPTPAIAEALAARGFDHLTLWGRGVDTELFRLQARDDAGIMRPLYLYVGRIAAEKNVEAFLDMSLPGTKWVIGDGPLRECYERAYPQVRFLGPRPHHQLAPYYNCADVLVFPSQTDTFGLVLLEAMACGVPVAAYPVPGPIDIVADGISGCLRADLERACFDALRLPREQVRRHAAQFSWQAASRQFLQNLVPVRPLQAETANPARPT